MAVVDVRCTPVCFDCGCIMRSEDYQRGQRKVQIWCETKTCREFGIRYWLPLAVRELTPVEKIHNPPL